MNSGSNPASAKAERARVLFVNHTAKLGGGEIALLNLISHLDRSRFEPIVALFSHGPLAQQLEERGIETHVIEAPNLVDVRKDTLGRAGSLRITRAAELMKTIWRLARLIRRRQIDLIHANSLKADIIAAFAGRLAWRPVIWHVRDRIADDYLPARIAALFRSLARWLPSFVIANSRATLETLVPAGGPADETRFEIVHDGTPDYANWPGEVPANDGGPIIGLVGRISPWKGQDVFLRAAARVLRDFPSARFQIIGAPLFGEDDYEQSVKTLADSLGIAGRVWFAGFRSDVRELIGRMNVLVHASTVPEPFGQVIIEGMAASKPVVATAGGGALEIVRDGVTGLLAPMGDDAGMAGAIGKLLSDPVRAAAMGAAGRRRIGQYFCIERTAANVEAIYSRILSTDTPSPRTIKRSTPDFTSDLADAAAST